MTDELTEMAVGLMVDAGLEIVPNDLEVGGVTFRFTLVLSGGERSLDLILVSDAQDETERLPQKISALGRALDFVGSRRSLTVVVIGWEPSEEARTALSRLARVLVVPIGAPISVLRDALLVLLPLTASSTIASEYDSTAELTALAGSEAQAIRESEILDPGLVDSIAVREALRRWLVEPLNEMGARS